MYKTKLWIFKEYAYSACVWFLIGLLSLFVLAPMAIVMRLLRDSHDGTSAEEVEKSEREILRLHQGVTSEYTVANQCRVHYLACQTGKKNTMILIHGVYGSSISFLNLMRSLSDEYDVYAIDLPGFGRSPNVILPDRKDYVEFYGELIAAFMDALDIQTAVIGGHSFGGFIAIQFAKNHIRYASKGLVLFNPVGVFPCGSSTGTYWSTLFCSGVLQITRWTGTSRRIRKYMSSNTAYWYDLLSNPTNYGTEILNHYMEISNVKSRWTEPVIADLCNLNCRVMLVYGMDEGISPADQGVTIQQMNPSFRLLMVPFASHNPISTPRNARIVSKAIGETFIQTRMMNRREFIAREIKLDFTKYESSFCMSQTQSTIEKLYQDLLI